MPDNQSAGLLLLEGIFHDPEDSLQVFPEDGPPVHVDDKLSEFEGRQVSLALHHLPPTPRLPEVPGAGACLWGPMCPCGHQEKFTWLYSGNWEGVLKRSVEGTWEVSGTTIPFHHYMIGHRGRLLLFSEGSSGRGVDDLAQEVDSLLGLLRGLRAVVLEDE